MPGMRGMGKNIICPAFFGFSIYTAGNLFCESGTRQFPLARVEVKIVARQIPKISCSGRHPLQGKNTRFKL
jgi:hypothetical protein